MKRICFAFALTLAASASTATDLDVADFTETTGNIATIPVTINNDSGDLSTVVFTISQPAGLPAPTAVPGSDQANLLPGDVFVDDLGSDQYRITAFVRNSPDVASDPGNVINIQYDLTGVPATSYPISVASSEFYTIANAQDTVDSESGGTLTVNTAASVGEWLTLDVVD